MSKPMVRLSIIVVSYNTREMTCACIRSVFNEARSKDFELIVIDNASTDGSADAIESEFSDRVRLIRSKDNLGFARANNVAAKQAKGDFILLLNPDTVILEHAVDSLMEFAADHPGAGIWGGRTVFESGLLNPSSCWRFMSLWSIFAQAVGLTSLLRKFDAFNPEGYGGWRRDTVRQVDFITGCFLLITRDLWERLGGFDENFYMYAEEADLCYRAHQMGAQPAFTPAATIVHHGGASEPVLSDKVMRLFRGKITFLIKHWPPHRRFLGVSLFQLCALVRMTGYRVVSYLTFSDKHRTAAQEWRKVWSARREWTDGYSVETK